MLIRIPLNDLRVYNFHISTIVFNGIKQNIAKIHIYFK